jgi:hypothetical protein
VPLEIVEEMINQLSTLRDRERDADLRGSYKAAIERRQALAYRIRKAGEPGDRSRTHQVAAGMEAPAPGAPEGPSPSKETLVMIDGAHVRAVPGHKADIST